MSNDAGEWIAAMCASVAETGDEELVSQYSKLSSLHEMKLWHQLTVALVEFISLPRWQEGGDILLDLFESFVMQVSSKINQLRFSQIAVSIATQHAPSAESSAKLLEEAAERVKAEIVSGGSNSSGSSSSSSGQQDKGTVKGRVEEARQGEVMLLCTLAGVRLATDPDCAKKLLDEQKDKLDNMEVVDSSVRGSYFVAAAEYYKVKGPAAEYYHHALQYLCFVPLELLSPARQRDLAFSTCLAALVGESVYNFAELLSHPVVGSLKGTAQEWVVHVVRAFNRGDIAAYEQLVQTHEADFLAQPALVAHATTLKMKIAVLCLMELIFNRDSEQRVISFDTIAQATRMPVGEVEALVMKTFSLGLVKGQIDEVDKEVAFSWVLPRLLEHSQVGELCGRLSAWHSKVMASLLYAEDHHHQLPSH